LIPKVFWAHKQQLLRERYDRLIAVFGLMRNLVTHINTDYFLAECWNS
jgi:hypothetical protein